MVNDFVGLFIIFLPRVVLFRVATPHIALRDRRPKGRERGKMRGIVVPSHSCAHFHFPPSLLRPVTHATLPNVIVATEYVLGCLECCYHDHQMEKRLMVVGVMNK